MVRGGGLLSRWAGASQGGCALQWARSIAGASSHQQYRPFSTKKQPDDFVDPAAKEEFDQIMGAIESGRCGQLRLCHTNRNWETYTYVQVIVIV